MRKLNYLIKILHYMGISDFPVSVEKKGQKCIIKITI